MQRSMRAQRTWVRLAVEDRVWLGLAVLVGVLVMLQGRNRK